MSTALQIQMLPDTGFSVKDLDKFLFALEGRLKSREIMQKEEAAQCLGGISTRMLERLSNDNIVPSHYIPGTSIRVWIRSEIEAVPKTWGSKRTRKAKRDNTQSKTLYGESGARLK